MLFRCFQCGGTRRVDYGQVAVGARLACRCGRVFVLRDGVERGTDAGTDAEAAEAFAQANDIDLASAYSVRLGLVSLDAVRSWRTERRRKPRAVAGSPKSEAPEGDVPDALILTGPDRRSWSHRLRDRRVVTTAVLAVLIVLVAGFWGRIEWRRLTAESRQVAARAEQASAPASRSETSPEPTNPVSPAQRLTHVEKNDMGQIVRITAPTPETVLLAFCESAMKRVPLEVTVSRPPRKGVRLGVFKDVDGSTPQTISIRRSRESPGWVAGDGSQPIEGFIDARDRDDDGDGVADADDFCPGTVPGDVLNPNNGCTIAQLCLCDSPRGSSQAWKNHGKYFSCVVQAANDFNTLGLLDSDEKRAIVSEAARSSCGDNRRSSRGGASGLRLAGQ